MKNQFAVIHLGRQYKMSELLSDDVGWKEVSQHITYDEALAESNKLHAEMIATDDGTWGDTTPDYFDCWAIADVKIRYTQYCDGQEGEIHQCDKTLRKKVIWKAKARRPILKPYTCRPCKKENAARADFIRHKQAEEKRKEITSRPI